MIFKKIGKFPIENYKSIYNRFFYVCYHKKSCEILVWFHSLSYWIRCRIYWLYFNGRYVFYYSENGNNERYLGREKRFKRFDIFSDRHDRFFSNIIC